MIADQLREVELFAWVGEDDSMSGPRTGEIGLKQGVVPAGTIPIIATTQAKVDQGYIRAQMEAMADHTGKRRYLARFTFKEIIRQTEHGE